MRVRNNEADTYNAKSVIESSQNIKIILLERDIETSYNNFHYIIFIIIILLARVSESILLYYALILSTNGI